MEMEGFIYQNMFFFSEKKRGGSTTTTIQQLYMDYLIHFKSKKGQLLK